MEQKSEGVRGKVVESTCKICRGTGRDGKNKVCVFCRGMGKTVDYQGHKELPRKRF